VVANYKCIELCSAFATPHPILGEVVGLAIQINDKEFDIIEFKKYLTKRMSSSKMPSEIFVFDQIELSSNGKIDRNKLQAKIKQSSIK
jgi:acyl-CoA synthetase (AMP-forming)/AMP-acid ligase II